MDRLTFVTQLTRSLAWPLAIVAILAFFRKEVKSKLAQLEGLQGPGGIKADFAHEVDKVAADLPVSASEKQQAIELEKEGLDPSLIVIQAWTKLEEQLQEVAVARNLRDGRGAFRNPELIASKIELPRETLNDLRKLRTLRNKVVHEKLKVSKADAIQFNTAIERILPLIPAK